MLGQIILGAAAAFGVFCVLWAIWGLFLPSWRGSVLVFLCPPHRSCDAVIVCYRWLRGLGMIRAPLLLVDSDLPDEERLRLVRHHPYLEFCSLEELPSRLERERREFD